jgi:anaerobic magnesium-protoporphyrin IX monomethyl ester cyclase
VRIVLADLKATDGLVSKDTVAGGYGSRMKPFSQCTRLFCHFKRRFHSHRSILMAYLAAICADAGHDVQWTDEDIVDGDVAIILSSLVDYRRETWWADRARQRGLKVGFVGLAASKVPHLFSPHADFVVNGEPEEAIRRLVGGENLTGNSPSSAITDLDSIPFPRWDLLSHGRKAGIWRGVRPAGGGIPVLSSRSCPEFCTYCPHRILSAYRVRSVRSVVEELTYLCSRFRRPYVVFRDPLFTQQRDRCLELCEAIQAKGLNLKFECETRLDRLDDVLLDRMQAAGLRMITFGVEAVSEETLKRVGRRPIPELHQREVMASCHRRGIVTAAYYVFGFLQDTWETISATIDYAISLKTSFAQFKLLTPYPATPLWKQLQPLIYEEDWEHFDGYTPTFRHPNLSADQLTFLLGAAYARFYCRPSWLGNYLRIREEPWRRWIHLLDNKVISVHERKELLRMSRTVTC